jgi:endonuclease/exonuclease/phosphatase family metal-dependent hydrolase
MDAVLRRLASCSLSIILVLSGCDPFGTGFDDVEPAERFQAAELVATTPLGTSLVVLDWNIKFGGGRVDFFFDCFGDEVLIDRHQVVGHLEGIASKIRQVDPDVVLLQEVDVNSKRTAHVDQLQWLLDHTDLNYGVYASQWRADFIPSDGLGPMDDGNAVLSRWPIRDAERLALPLRTDQSGLTRYFYLRRNILRARIELAADLNLWVLNVHADAYGEDGTKRKHIDALEREMDALEAEDAWLLGGGDLNTLPPGTDKLFDFPDSVCEDEEFVADDYREEVGWLDGLYGRYAPFVPTADYAANNAAYFSHTVDGRGFWNRQLDYLFTNGAWVEGSGVVHQDGRTGMATMPLSDHAPVSAEVAVP